MGGLCSRHSPAFHSVDNIGHVYAPKQQQAQTNLSGPLKAKSNTHELDRKTSPVTEKSSPPPLQPLRPHNHCPVDLEDFSFEETSGSRTPGGISQADGQRLSPSSAAGDMDDFSDDFGDGSEKGDRKKLARVLSTKAKTARSRTTTVAKKGAAKMNEVGVLIGRAGTVGLEKAVEALDTIGSSVTSINFSGGFSTGAAPKGNKIGILAFEVANTIVKGYNLKQSLSDESMKIMKEEILRSEGVQRLVSTDMEELLIIAADDKRNELKVFSGEVVRFGNHCRDPQWHQLDRIFEKLGNEMTLPKQSKEDAEAEMQNLMTLAQHTAELYHELHALDRFELDYRRKVQEEEMFGNSQRGDNLAILRSELKSQRKHVKNLKKKSLWSKVLEEVMEMLVDVVYFLYQEIQTAFGDASTGSCGKENNNSAKGSSVRLGPAGLSLHFANIINQIDILVSRPSSVSPNARDNLYQGLPPNIKASLRNKMLTFPIKEDLTIPQIKEEMERTLAWLVPVAANTTKAHHGFGWVGEWANTGSSLDRRQPGHVELTLLQTLHHADQRATENYILELIVWLQQLVSLARSQIPGNKSPIKSPIRSPVQQPKMALGNTANSNVTSNGHTTTTPELSPEDQVMLQSVKNRKITPGISKSQEFNTSKKKLSHHRLSKSNSHSPCTFREAESASSRRHTAIAPFDFELDRSKALDVIDRVDNI